MSDEMEWNEIMPRILLPKGKYVREGFQEPTGKGGQELLLFF